MKPEPRATAPANERDDRGVRREGGVIAVTTALLLGLLLLVGGLATDLGYWYVRSGEIERAADAAALAAVVWMPDLVKATDVAQKVAAENGYVNGLNGVSVDVAPIPSNSRRLKVTITDSKVRRILTAILGQGPLRIKRSAVGEYTKPVPMGSRTNFLGTGFLATNAADRENLWLAINGFCTSAEHGDPVSSKFDGSAVGNNGGSYTPTWTANQSNIYTACPPSMGAPAGGPEHPNPAVVRANPYYSPNGYTYVIEVPAGRTYTTDVMFWDPAFHPCNDKDASDAARSNDSAGRPVYSNRSCPAGLASTYPNPINYYGQITTNYALYQSDNTPYDDNDNPIYSGCGGGRPNPKTFNTGDATPGTAPSAMANPTYTAAFRDRWYTMCTIPAAPASTTSERWLLRIQTVPEANSGGVNDFAIFLNRSTSAGTGCDSTIPATGSCPRIYAAGQYSVEAKSSAASCATATDGNFFLAEIGSEYAGKTLEVSLFDAGEGSNFVQILDPTGTAATFTWRTTDADNLYNTPTGPITQLNDVSMSGQTQLGNTYDSSRWKFNDRMLVLSTPLPLTYPGGWWKIRYNFATCGDRTTWGATVVGNPVHLVQ